MRFPPRRKPNQDVVASVRISKYLPKYNTPTREMQTVSDVFS